MMVIIYCAWNISLDVNKH